MSPLSVFDQLLDELQPSPDATMSDEKGCCPCDFRLSLEIFSRMSIHTIVILQDGAVHNGDIARGGKVLVRVRFFTPPHAGVAAAAP